MAVNVAVVKRHVQRLRELAVGNLGPTGELHKGIVEVLTSLCDAAEDLEKRVAKLEGHGPLAGKRPVGPPPISGR
jgi:hypothetical protein